MKKIISFNVNDAKQELYLDTRKTLLKMLREDLELMGVHLGCGGGDCGACTVLLNGEPVTSCLVLAVDCEGAEITTVEGVQQNGELHPLQQSMIEKGGIQCGFCTPGMVMNSLALLRENPQPTEVEVRQALSGNLCRCTGYAKIVEAVLDTGKTMTNSKEV
ncbi:MAG: (2Fe-2S)-binding protein [Candidatus Marinimicrobia bacterium]|jgi:carbon-monoxide dehydrogenase small subunit|nr:(2Fe-2S)-binding protein [SAR324 cluster bacterium]MDP7072673.1 (2Fe-2S)-binding protein [Candidatus Neomarinimicrobiota bacterium]